MARGFRVSAVANAGNDGSRSPRVHQARGVKVGPF